MNSNHPPPSKAQVLIVGAGLAGLSCARILQEAGMEIHLLEAADGVGGRVRTDREQGFLLDRGFQVLLTAYDELQEQVELEELDLRAFRPGSLIWDGRSLLEIPDPWREPGSAFRALRASVGTFQDKARLAKLRAKLLGASPRACLEGPDTTTQQELEALGFTEGFIDTFLRPFLGGVFLERELETTSRLFRYYFRCFSAGKAAVPSRGMGALPELMAQGLEDRITLGARVVQVSATGATLSSGESIRADHVVLAVDGPSAASLLDLPPPPMKATITSYFSAPEPPVDSPLLVLDGQGTGPANHVAVMSLVAPEYAPPGAHLVSVSGVGEAARDPDMFRASSLEQMGRWFGPGVGRWEHLRTYVIPKALPSHPPGTVPHRPDPMLPDDAPVLAGDHTVFGAIQGALLSGRRAAEKVLGEP